MALTNPNKLINVQELNYFEGKLASKYQTKTIALEGITATSVEGALVELKNAIGGSDVSFEKLVTPNTGKAATYRFTKGSGAGAVTMDIDIEKDNVRAIVGFVTITEGTGADAGKYFDGTTEVGSADGVTHAGIYLKSQELADGTATGVVKYADASAVIEYITSGSQAGDMIVLTIDANHQITASITDGTVTKAKLAQGVQDSLDAADSAYQLPSGGIPATDMASAVQTSLGLADSAYQLPSGGIPSTDMAQAVQTSLGLADSAYQKPSGGIPSTDLAESYKTTQTAVSDPTKGNAPALEFIATISQNTNGEITATKQGIQVAADGDIDEIFA